MLVLSRRTDQKVVFPNVGITLNVLKVRGQVVKLGIEAPSEIEIMRPEAKERPSESRGHKSAVRRHDLKGRVNNLRLALAVFERQRELGLEDDAQQTFQRLLDLLTDLDQQLSATGDNEVAPTKATAEGLRLLVVEDNDNERELLAGLLRLHGYDVTVATNGVDALEVLDTQSPPDLVLLDMNMPHRNGMEVVEQIRRDRRLRNLPVFAVTGTDPGSYGNQAELARFNGWVQKPVDPTRLLSAIRTSKHAKTKL